jgi:hypothetical protein
MSFQTKAVTIAAVAGLALAALSQLSSVLSNGFTPLDTINIFNTSMLGYWVGALGFVPLIFIIIAIAATARKAGLLSSILNGLGAIVGVTVVIVIAVISVAASQKTNFPYLKSGPDRTTFVASVLPVCIKGQQAIPENKKAPAATINELCDCYGNSLADATTADDVQYFDQHHEPSQSTVENMKESYQKCLQAVRYNHP